ncbi:MAG: D-alanyl-D-alanine carboxypeptidase/D-alanyl-D-alanine-endopeptidase [Pseudomonadota bacterium]
MESSLRPLARPEDLRRQLGAEGVISRFGLSGVVACAVADVKSGLELEAVRGDMPLPPASVAKALTAVYAMDALGADYRFQTRLLASAPIRGGILEGDLILRGGGDPTLDTDDLATLAAGLKEAGLRELRGQFIVDDSFLPFARTIDAGQLDHVGYSPSVSGIALNFNRVHFEWKRSGGSYAVTMDARTARYRPDVSMARMRVAQRSLPVYTYADKGDFDDWSVARGALGNGGARWLPVRKPALYAGDVFRTMARAQGLVLPKTTVREGKAAGLQTLVIHNSAPLPVILRGMLKYSTNLTAEMVGMTASVARGTPPGSLRGSAQVMSRWAATELGMTGTSMVDHSGLGSTSQMTANDLTRALVRIGQRGILRPLLKPFVLRGANGREVNPSTLRVDAKTGTLNYVSGLGGFITASDGTDMAFAIFTANPEVRKTIRREDSERPQGARGWNSRSRRLQSRLIERWGQIYGS